MSKLNDAFVADDIDDALLAREISISRGTSARDMRWQTTTCALGDLVADLVTFERGPKDGKCIIQGALAPGATQRLAKAVAQNYILMLDFDTGVTLDEVMGEIMRRELFAVVWTTHSHLKEQTSIPEGALMRFLKKSGWHGHVGDITVDQCAQYLRTARKYRAEILATAELDKREMTKNGVEFFVRHAPMPRLRALFVLDTPFNFGGRGKSQRENIDEWKQRYGAVCDSLGLPHEYDTSCSDPARLMYLPRIAPGAEIGEGKHEIVVIAGKAFDFEALSISDASVPRNAFTSNTNSGGFTNQRRVEPLGEARHAGDGAWTPETPGLLRWLKLHGRDFRASDWYESLGREVRFQHDNGMDSVCPNVDAHSSGDNPGDRSFRVLNADGENSWHMLCLHQGCKDASGGDRAWYLDLALREAGQTVDDLVEFSESAREAKAAADKAEADTLDAKKTLEDRVAALTAETTDTDVMQLLSDAAKSGDDELFLERLVNKISERTGRTKPVLRKTLRRYREKHNQEREKKRDSTVEQARPKTGNETLDNWPMPHRDFGIFGIAAYLDSPYVWEMEKDDDGNLQFAAPLCTPIAITARVQYYDQNVEGQRWQALTTKGIELIDLPASEAMRARGNELAATLRDLGVRFTDKGVSLVKRMAMGYAPNAEPILIVAKPGWYDIGYISPLGEMFPTVEQHPTVELAEGNPIKGVARGGTLEGAKAIAEAVLASGHEGMQMGLLAGPVGALLDLAQLDSFTMYFGGDTSKGKSTSQKLKASAWGPAQLNKGLFRRASGTPNARENMIIQGNGCTIDFDETRGFSGEEVEDMIFRVQGGKTKERAHITGEKNRKARDFKTCTSMSGETDIIQKIESDGKAMTGGTVARVLFVDLGGAPKLTAQQMVQVEACESYYGWAGPLVVEQLIAQGYAEEPHRIAQDIATAARMLTGDDASELQLRAARMYGAVWLSAQLLQDAGYISATFDIEGLLRRQWEGRFAEDRQEGRAVVDRALEKLRHGILAAEIASSDGPVVDRKTGSLLAATYKDRGFYCVPIDAIQLLVGKLVDSRRVSSELSKSGMLFEPIDATRHTHRVMPDKTKITHLRIKDEFFREVNAAGDTPDAGKSFRDAAEQAGRETLH